MGVPTYVVFAGVNGAGKSTFYHTEFWLTDGLSRSLPRINADEILLEQGGNPVSGVDQIKAGREALRKLDYCLNKHRSFNQETTLTGQKCIRTIERARTEGYRIILYYIGISSAEAAMSRIEHRGTLGGHVIDDETVRRRWRSSLENLSRALALCDEVVVIDNSIEFVQLARWANGALAWVGNIKKYGSWLIEAVMDDSIWKG